MVLVVANTYLVSINAESSGQPVTNVVGIRGAFDSAENVTQVVLNGWTQAGGPITKHNTSYIMKDVSAMFLGTADGEVYTRQSVAPGTVSGTKSTNAACALVSYGGASRSRTSKGRMYFGPIGEADINSDGRTLSSTSITGIQSAFNLFRTTITNAGLEWVVVSRKLQAATPITTIGVQSVIATQRRRIR